MKTFILICAVIVLAITAVLAFVDTTLSVTKLLGIGFIGLALFAAAHLPIPD